MGQTKVVTLHPFDEDEAFTWLSDRLDGRVEMNLSELSRQFGWSHAKLRGRLATWAGAGRITQAPAGRGRVILAPPTALPAGRSMSTHAATLLVGRTFGAGAPPVQAPSHKPARSVVTIMTAAVLFATALGLTAVGLVMNARFAASFGQTVEAAMLLAAIGLAVDLLAVVLPSVAVQLWHRGSVLAAGAAWTIWLAALSMTLLAATGFASTHIGDAVAGRAKISSEHALVVERIERLRQERASLSEMRSTAAIAIELQRAQTEAQSVWAITAGCRDVTRPASARTCAPVLQLREAMASAERRDTIELELREAQAKLAGLPAIAASDPQATAVSEIVTWLSAGSFNPAAADVSKLRTLGLALMPSLAGLIGMLAMSLAYVRRS